MLIPPVSLARQSQAPAGEVSKGVYLTWAGVRGLRAEEFRKKGFNGAYFDVGALGDELFLRSGFYESEGMPPSEARWTKGDFAIELPVWPGQNLHEVVLIGTLPEGLRDRVIKVEISDTASGRKMVAQKHFDKKGYGEYALPLPEALSPGVYLMRFTVDTWSPSERGMGGDARRLGFFLDGIGLRSFP